MGKGNQNQHTGLVLSVKSQSNTTQPPAAVALNTTTAIASHPTLGYKFRVLLHDFLNVTKDPKARRRINTTTDEHYISLPYFSQEEAVMVKSAIVDVDLGQHRLGAAMPGGAYYTDEEGGDDSLNLAMESLRGKAFDEVVPALLKSFIDKRRASGDIRPCGPHHLAPMYALLFGIDLREVQDDRFLGRLRRAGI